MGSSTKPPTKLLSRRELEVAALVADGLTNKAIANRLHISERTADGHLEHIREKLGVGTRAQVAAWYVAGTRTDGASSTAAVFSNLPISLTKFIGREKEMVAVERLLLRHRLVTITGLGGVGKTRLALAIAARQSHWPRVRLVDLAPVREEHQVAGETAARLGERSIQRAIEELCTNPTLIVLDNCEHLVQATAVTAAKLLRSSPVVLLATSREPLNVESERVYPLAALDLVEAVALFENRAHEEDLERRHVEDICRLLDGLPLAVELAAARTRVMSLPTLKASLDRSMGALADGRIDRHRSLEASIRWSYDPLSSPEQAVFRALGVFEGPFGLDAAEFTADTDEHVVLSLADRSLVSREGDGYRLLFPVREFARRELGICGEDANVSARHDMYYVKWAMSRRDALLNEQPGVTREVWSAREEIRPALDRLAKWSPGDFACLASVFASSVMAWGDLHDAGRIARQAVTANDDEQHPQAAFVHLIAATTANYVREFDRGLAEARHAHTLAVALGDRLVAGLARFYAHFSLSCLDRHEEALDEIGLGLESLDDGPPDVRARLLNGMAMEYWYLGRYAEGASSASSALAISTDESTGRSAWFDSLARCLAGLGDVTGAAEAQVRAAELILRYEMRLQVVDQLTTWARVALAAGDEPQAAAFAAVASRLATELRTFVDFPVWEDPAYAGLIDRHQDAVRSLATCDWKEATLAALNWGRSQAARAADDQ